MTIADPNTGTIGGMPAANIMYGPANAALMGYQARDQNMANARAQTASTQAQTAQTQAATDRSNQLLPYDIQHTQATTNELNANTQSVALKNEAEAGVPADVRSAGVRAGITQNQVKASDAQHQFLQDRIISNAGILDGMTRQEQQNQLEEWGRQSGLPPGYASSAYGKMADARGTDGGPAGKISNFTQLRKDLIDSSKEIQKTKMEQEGATKRTEMTTTAEQKVASMKIDAELKLKGIEESSNPQTAYQYLQNRSVEALNAGDTAMADQYKQRSDAAYEKSKEMAVAQAAAHNAYGANLPALGIANNADVRPGQTPATPGTKGAPTVGQDLGGGARLIGGPGVSGAAGGIQAVPNSAAARPSVPAPAAPAPKVAAPAPAPVQQPTAAPAAPAPTQQPLTDVQQYNAQVDQNIQRRKDMAEDHDAAVRLASNPSLTREHVQGEMQKVAALVGQARSPEEKYQLQRILMRLSFAHAQIKT